MAKEKLLQWKNGKGHGTHRLDPDYPKYMHSNGLKKQVPLDDIDLTPYGNWVSGKEHFDYKNDPSNTMNNRFLLVGRPQIGKTGAFLHLGYLLWHELGEPINIGPGISKEHEIVESNEGDEVDDLVFNVNNLQTYPSFDHLKSLKLRKPGESKRYGNPNKKEVQRWYLNYGKTYPYPGCLINNSLLNRNKLRPEVEVNTSIPDIHPLDSHQEKSVLISKIYNKFCSKQIYSLNSESERSLGEILRDNYIQQSLGGIGTLLINKRSVTHWTLKKDMMPHLNPNLQLPPIIMPSSGRSSSALLDLTDALEGSKDYVQIVIIRHEERESYLKICQFHDALDVLVMDEGVLKTIGTARYYAKKLGEVITSELRSKFIFMLDDNILSWSGVTLKNDPCPLFDKDPNHKYAQQTDISLLNLLTHMKSEDYKNISQFSIVGFSLSKRNIKGRVCAYSRQHVFAAVFLNLQKLKGLDYRKCAWAMEDIDFNWKSNELSFNDANDGVIVKCLRYVASKKKICQGGVVPDNIPEDMISKLQNCKEWSSGTKKENKSEKETRTLDLEPEVEKTKIVQEPKRERWALEDAELKRERELREGLEAKLRAVEIRNTNLEKENQSLKRKLELQGNDSNKVHVVEGKDKSRE